MNLPAEIQNQLDKLPVPKEIYPVYLSYFVLSLLVSTTCNLFNLNIDPQISISSNAFLANLLTVVLSQRDSDRIQKTLQLLKQKVKQLEDRIDKEYIKTDEFAFLIKKTWPNLIDEYRAEMIEAYTNLLVNFSTVRFSEKDTKEYYLNLIVGLTPRHILTIKFLVEYFRKEGMSNDDKNRSVVRNYLFSSFKGKMPDSDLSILDGITADLIAKGILREDFLPTYGGGTQLYVLMPLAQEVLKLITLQED